MGYYDDELRPGDIAVIEEPTDQLESADATISEDLDGDFGDGIGERQLRPGAGW
jgi:hypothetical protein